jgi:hypothetical protein
LNLEVVRLAASAKPLLVTLSTGDMKTKHSKSSVKKQCKTTAGWVCSIIFPFNCSIHEQERQTLSHHNMAHQISFSANLDTARDSHPKPCKHAIYSGINTVIETHQYTFRQRHDYNRLSFATSHHPGQWSSSPPKAPRRSQSVARGLIHDSWALWLGLEVVLRRCCERNLLYFRLYYYHMSRARSRQRNLGFELSVVPWV